MTKLVSGHDYGYSATKSTEDGRFYGGVYFYGDNSTDQIGTIDGIRTVRGVKSFSKSVAERHRRETQPVNTHSDSHYLSGALAV